MPRVSKKKAGSLIARAKKRSWEARQEQVTSSIRASDHLFAQVIPDSDPGDGITADARDHLERGISESAETRRTFYQDRLGASIAGERNYGNKASGHDSCDSYSASSSSLCLSSDPILPTSPSSFASPASSLSSRSLHPSTASYLSTTTDSGHSDSIYQDVSPACVGRERLTATSSLTLGQSSRVGSYKNERGIVKHHIPTRVFPEIRHLDTSSLPTQYYMSEDTLYDGFQVIKPSDQQRGVDDSHVRPEITVLRTTTRAYRLYQVPGRPRSHAGHQPCDQQFEQRFEEEHNEQSFSQNSTSTDSAFKNGRNQEGTFASFQEKYRPSSSQYAENDTNDISRDPRNGYNDNLGRTPSFGYHSGSVQERSSRAKRASSEVDDDSSDESDFSYPMKRGSTLKRRRRC